MSAQLVGVYKYSYSVEHYGHYINCPLASGIHQESLHVLMILKPNSHLLSCLYIIIQCRDRPKHKLSRNLHEINCTQEHSRVWTSCLYTELLAQLMLRCVVCTHISPVFSLDQVIYMFTSRVFAHNCNGYDHTLLLAQQSVSTCRK